MIRISDIRIDGGTQSRAEFNEQTVAEYAEVMADPNTVFPPVVVYSDGKDYWLADGFHRLAAWQRIGREEIPADIREGDRRMAILHSVASNSAHGLRRTNADKRHAVMLLLEDPEWSGWSDREIARRCAVSNRFVSNLRAALSVNGSQIETDGRPRTVERGGTIYTQNTDNIGGSRQSSEPEPEAGADDDASFAAFYGAVKANDREAAAKDAASDDDTFLAALDEAEKDATETDNPADISAADIEKNAPQKDDSRPEEAESEPEDPDMEPMSEAERQARKGLSTFTRHGLEDLIIGLRIENGEYKAEIRRLERKVEEQDDQISHLAADDQAQQVIKAREEVDRHKQQSGYWMNKHGEERKLANRLRHVIKKLEKEIKALKAPQGEYGYANDA